MNTIDCPYCHSLAHRVITDSPKTVKCEFCGLYRLFPRMNAETQKSHLQEYEKKINLSNYSHPESGVERHASELKFLQKYFPGIFKGGTVLDVGCAEGSFLYAMNRYGADTIGIEPSSTLSDFGKKFGLKIYAGRFDHDTISKIPKKRFDLISFRDSFYYLPDLRQTFDLLREILALGGKIYIKSHSVESMYYMRVTSDRTSRFGRYVSGMATRRTLNTILAKEGYEIVHSGYYPAHRFIGRIIQPLADVLEISDRFITLAQILR